MNEYCKVKVSIIMPSLNVRKYIDECISSVVNQTLKEIEIICVDAGSTDGTLEVINKYAEVDDRIKVIHSDIKSYGYQMNIGIDSARGEYIGIVETDDCVPKNMYEQLYSVAHNNDVDMVKADFYRFTGDGDERVLNHWVLTNDEDMYNRIVNVQHTIKCFSLLLNTWSGIYRKDFLIEHNIRHNESLGASYQDNGFWFQTLIHAKKAYFVDKPYYMNRRDNVGSSVFNYSNTFKIFGEFHFIWDKLSEDADKLRKYRLEYGAKACSSYLYFLNNACKEAKLDFIQRFSEEIKWLRENDAFPIFHFNAQDLEVILSIANNPDEYYESVICARESFENTIREYETVIIYGAGMIGRRLYNSLKIQANPVNVKCFAVTDTKADNRRKQDKIPVVNIEELVCYKDSALIIIAVTGLYKNEMVNNARTLGFKHILCIPEDKKPVFKTYLENKDYQSGMEEWYRYVTSSSLNLHNPTDFPQLQQLLLLRDNSNLQSKIVDRRYMKEYIKSRIGIEFVIPTLDEFDRCEDIDFNKYGRKFLIINNIPKPCRYHVDTDYKEYNHEMVIRKVNAWKNIDNIFRTSFSEYNYGYKLLIESSNWDNDILVSHTYYAVCMNGAVKLFMVITHERFNGTHVDFYDTDWDHKDYNMYWPNYFSNIVKPVFFEDMKRAADILAEDFKFVVICFRENSGVIQVDEIQKTLFGGIMNFAPRNVDHLFYKELLVNVNDY